MKKDATAVPPKTVREITEPLAPIGATCRLCSLGIEGADGEIVVTVKYGGACHRYEGNELAPLWKHRWVCAPCRRAIIDHFTESQQCPR